MNRQDIQNTPGADRTNGLEAITAYVRGSYVTHDQLHIRGGHQVSWLIDGVPVPNTNIASNVGPQFDPKDIDFLEVQRGSYDAQYGDRTYGVFNVSPFYHYNTANFDGGLNDPIVTIDERRSQYGGAQTTFSAEVAKHNLQVVLRLPPAGRSTLWVDLQRQQQSQPLRA